MIMSMLYANEPKVSDTQWIPSQPEALTYRSTSDQADRLSPVSFMKRDTTINAAAPTCPHIFKSLISTFNLTVPK
jgi:hypothetical protein